MIEAIKYTRSLTGAAVTGIKHGWQVMLYCLFKTISLSSWIVYQIITVSLGAAIPGAALPVPDKGTGKLYRINIKAGVLK